MSEADSTSRRRPPTIDLTAKEVETATPDSSPQPDAEAAASTTENAPGGQGASSSSRTLPYTIGIAIGAAGAAAVAAGLWFAGLAPIPERAAPQSAAAPSSAVEPSPPAPPAAPSAQTAATDQVSARLDRIEQALQAPPRTDSALTGRMAAVDAQTKALGDSLAALTRRVDEVAAAAQTALAQAKAAAVAADDAKSAAQSAAQTGVQRSDIDALDGRVSALQNAIKSLNADIAQRTSSSHADDRAIRLTVAAEALRAAVERGAPYQAELAAVTALGADQSSTAALQPYAAQGIPSAAELGRELVALVPSLYRATEREPSNNTFLGRLESQAQKLVRITPTGTSAAPVGDDPAALIARINAAAARGDIDAALAEIAKLPEQARAPVDGWAKKAGARRAALAESQHIAAAALAALAKPDSQ
ncbi:MAG: COG4223 family protein [Xanthobacteraceae bacterium]